ncbi:hypothetical protein KOI35_04155 [Actinoplanes bogorensis]|uniref:Uncharacterized protein n=1 Tax=Paractinoplanes bogorensis TaxID=1610840 RepID=A0ABS5YH57_9ACTN|nr:hypothetical protein [Actinoplanes bogorensis]MBU2662692.1 hypothetical protein [Actinoplanes bogorensis]
MADHERPRRPGAAVALLLIAAPAAVLGPLLVIDQVATIRAPLLVSGLALCLVAIFGVAWASQIFWPGPQARLRTDVITFLVLEAGIIALATAWLAHNQVLAGSLSTGVALLVPVAAAAVVASATRRSGVGALFALMRYGPSSRSRTARFRLYWVCVAAFESAAISAAVASGLRDRPAVLWTLIAVAALPLFIALGRVGFRSGDNTVPWPYGLAGVVVPTVSAMAVLVSNSPDWAAKKPGSAIAVTVGVAVVVAGLQRPLLGWLATGPVSVDEWIALGRAEVDRQMRAKRARADSPPTRTPSIPVPARRGGFARPLWTPAVSAALTDVIERTGLSLGTVWPRIELVLPPDVRTRLRRADRSIAARRVVTAAAVNTALACLVTLILTGFATLLALSAALALLGLASAFLADLSDRVSDMYDQRAEAVEIYRFDLARKLHVPIPRDPEAFIAAAGLLSGVDSPTELVPSEEPADDSAVRKATQSLVAELERLRAQQFPARRIDPPELSPEQLAGLADRVAQRAAEPVAEILSERLEPLVRQSIEDAVTGPPLVDFTGFMALDLADGSGRAGEVIRARAGGVLGMRFSVVRDGAPRDAFLITEPIEIEGGRAEPLAEFEAVADSPTLRPQPGRETLIVEQAAEAVFVFAVPERPGTHQIWFQLYQGGRLIQAVAVDVEAEPASVGE